MIHPPWLKVKIPSGENYNYIKKAISKTKTHSICEEALCPNIAECWNKKTATFLIMGNKCTRNCLYCNVSHEKPKELDNNEPKNIAEIIKKINLNYVVITSVTRDDLNDYGASHFINTINKIKKLKPPIKIEILTPDFNGNEKLIKKIIETKPFVFGHNIEVVKSYFKLLRPQGKYLLSLKLLKTIKKINPNQTTKSGLMIGFGENKDNIIETLIDLKKAEVDIITIGQYLQPSKEHYPVKKYYHPAEFEELKNTAIDIGVRYVYSGPLVRSSYYAEELISKA